MRRITCAAGLARKTDTEDDSRGHNAAAPIHSKIGGGFSQSTLTSSCCLRRARALSLHICTFPTLRDIIGPDEYSVMWRSINDTDLHTISVPQSALPSHSRRFLRSSSPRTARLFWIVSPLLIVVPYWDGSVMNPSSVAKPPFDAVRCKTLYVF